MPEDNFRDFLFDSAHNSQDQTFNPTKDFDDLDEVMRAEEHIRGLNSGQRSGQMRDRRYNCYDIQRSLGSELIPHDYAD